MRFAALLIQSCLIGAPASDKDIVLRGPLLQNATQTQIKICWETDPPSTGLVRVIDLQNKSVSTFSTTAAAARQIVLIDGLETDHKYQYELILGAGAATTAPTSRLTRATGTFTTAPPPGRPFAFIIWGDSRSDP